VIVPARQATQAGGIHSLESIPGLHKRLKIRALYPAIINHVKTGPNKVGQQKQLMCPVCSVHCAFYNFLTVSPDTFELRIGHIDLFRCELSFTSLELSKCSISSEN
jgi:hypothetical protein